MTITREYNPFHCFVMNSMCSPKNNFDLHSIFSVNDSCRRSHYLTEMIRPKDLRRKD